MAPESDIVADAISEVVAEADRLRASGRLPAGYEEDLDGRFAAVASDPEALARQVDGGALTRPQAYRFRQSDSAGRAQLDVPAGGRRGLRQMAASASHRSLRTAEGVGRRGATAARRVAGPRLRSLQRQTLDQAGRLAEVLATRAQVSADHARRLASSGGSSSRLDRLLPGGRTLPPAPTRAAGSSGSARVGCSQPDTSAAALADWALERIGRGPGGRVLHVECADGGLVRRMAACGYDAAGADPAAVASGRIARGSALERLGAERRSSLGGLVVSGMTDQVSPASARAIAHLASSRLQSGGVVVIVSAHPRPPGGDDPITSDLSLRRPLHPVTWCHLLARYGFAEITVFDPAGTSAAGAPGALYAVAGRRG
ncbi:MAG TPA: hypothetical protein VEH29_03055 [Acidimicrobiales bacterium]|nr:hypothetical protein [Acidimicrobiales bacterium]